MPTVFTANPVRPVVRLNYTYSIEVVISTKTLNLRLFILCVVCKLRDKASISSTLLVMLYWEIIV